MKKSEFQQLIKENIVNILKEEDKPSNGKMVYIITSRDKGVYAASLDINMAKKLKQEFQYNIDMEGGRDEATIQSLKLK